jgi:hypothetical protein
MIPTFCDMNPNDLSSRQATNYKPKIAVILGEVGFRATRDGDGCLRDGLIGRLIYHGPRDYKLFI